MIDENNIDKNEAFYPHYKIVFKLCQMALLQKGKERNEKKSADLANEIKEIQTEIDTQTAISENLDFHQELRQEAQRMRDTEIHELQCKHNELKENMENTKRSDEDFIKDYFQALFADSE